MAWPYDQDLPVVIEAAFGADPGADPFTWEFVDVSDRLVRDNDIRTRTGRSPGALSTDAGSCSFTLDNDDGDWTPLNPFSTLYPYVRLGLPVRVRCRWVQDSFGRVESGSWGTADSGQVWGDQAGAASQYDVNAGVGIFTPDAVDADRYILVDTGVASHAVQVVLNTNVVPTGAATRYGVIGRWSDASNYYRVCAIVAPNTGVITLEIGKRVAGVLTVVATLATTLVISTDTNIAFSCADDQLRVKAWQGSGEPEWMLSATDTDLTTGTSAGPFARRETGNLTPTQFSFDDFAVYNQRFAGNVAALQPDFIPTTDGDPLSVTQVTASGIIRRLSQNDKPLRSAMFRSMAGVAPNDVVPLAYWSLEDGADATQFASALPGGVPMQLRGPALAVDDSLVGSQPLPNFDGTVGATAPIPAYTDTGKWTVQLAIKVEDPRPIAATSVVSVETANGKIAAGLEVSGQGLVLAFFDTAGTVTNQFVEGIPTFSTQVSNQWVSLVLQSEQDGSGSDDTATVKVLTPDGDLIHEFTEVSGAAFHAAGKRVNVSGALNGTGAAGVYGHVGFFSDAGFTLGTDDVANAQAMGGFDGELPTDRLERLCREDQVAIDILASGSTQPMGPQTTGTFLELLQECEAVDGGFLGEQTDGFGLLYVPAAARYNRPPGMSIDLATYNTASGTLPTVLAPTYDDQGVVNEYTASRPEGSSATVADSAHIARHGLYDGGGTVNVQADAQLPDQASWRVGQGTVDAMRYPNTPVNLHGNVDTVLPQWVGLKVGLSRVVRTGLPAKSGTADDDRMLDGYSETLEPRRWTGSYEGTPAQVWANIGVYGDDPGGVVSRYGARTTTLAEDLTSSETDVTVDAGTDVWATTVSHPALFPPGGPGINVDIGGITYSCTAITGTAPTYTLTVARLPDDRTHATGTPVTVTETRYYVL